MPNKPDVYTINNAPPPSYTETMEQVPMGNNPYVHPFYQQTSYNRESSQMFSNAPPIAPYPPTTIINPQHEPQTTFFPNNTTIIAVEENSTQKYVKTAICCRIIAILCSIICLVFIMIKLLQ